MLIIAHRGASKLAPENTLAAIAKARELNADGIECDVRLTADGIPVLFHDETLERLFGNRIPLSGCTLADLAYIAHGPQEIPTLEQAMEEAKNFSVINIELKNNSRWNGKLVKGVAPIIKRYPAEKIIISSFNPVALGRARRQMSKIRRGLIIGSGRMGIKSLLVWKKVLGLYSIHLNRQLAGPKWIEPLKAAGLKIFIWTVDDPDDIKTLTKLGVDGVITNVPDLMRRGAADHAG